MAQWLAGGVNDEWETASPAIVAPPPTRRSLPISAGTLKLSGAAVDRPVSALLPAQLETTKGRTPVKSPLALILPLCLAAVGASLPCRAADVPPEILKQSDQLKDSAMAPKLDKSRKYVAYCNGAHCWRSPAMILFVKSIGYDNVLWLRDGLPEWKKKGYATE